MSNARPQLPRVVRIAKWLAWGSFLAYLARLYSLLFFDPWGIISNILSVDVVLLIAFFIFIRRRIFNKACFVFNLLWFNISILLIWLPSEMSGICIPHVMAFLVSFEYAFISSAYGLLLTREARTYLCNRLDNTESQIFLEKRVAAYVHDLRNIVIFHVPAFLVIVLLMVFLQNSVKAVAALFILFGISSFLIYWLYFARAESSLRQATRGKFMKELLVVDKAGHRISFCRATIRHLLFVLCCLTFGLAFLPALFSKKGVFLHDYLSRTRVIPATSTYSKCSIN